MSSTTLSAESYSVKEFSSVNDVMEERINLWLDSQNVFQSDGKPKAKNRQIIGPIVIKRRPSELLEKRNYGKSMSLPLSNSKN